MSLASKAALWLAGIAVVGAVSQGLTNWSWTRCAADGRRSNPYHAVTVCWPDQTERMFCSVGCAVSFLVDSKSKPPLTIGVHDEGSGAVSSAARAHYVQSDAIWLGDPRDHVHVFVNWVDALVHQEEFGGNPIENPFRPWIEEQ